MFNTLYVPYFK